MTNTCLIKFEFLHVKKYKKDTYNKKNDKFIGWRTDIQSISSFNLLITAVQN